jgi:hypothetical protein
LKEEAHKLAECSSFARKPCWEVLSESDGLIWLEIHGEDSVGSDCIKLKTGELRISFLTEPVISGQSDGLAGCEGRFDSCCRRCSGDTLI